MDGNFKQQLRERARELGFLDARVAPSHVPDAAAAAYRQWVANGYHGEMGYMERLVDERAGGADHVLPGARSVIVLAASYWFPAPSPHQIDENHITSTPQHVSAPNNPATSPENIRPESPNPPNTRVRVARYALGKDYHYVFRERLAPLVAWMDETLPGHQWRICTDSAPLLERSYAAAAGLGFIGKNGMLISWLSGSYTLLAEIVTTAELEPDEPRFGTCGQCTRCLDACPTQAFTGPGILDARKCISYLTIEKKSELTPEESAATGEWVFGCDICQDVCPYNKAPQPGHINEFAPGTIVTAMEPPSTFLEPQSNRQFERRFASSPILRAGKRRLQKLAKSKTQ